MVMLLCASKFAMAKIECSFDLRRSENIFKGTIYFAVDGTHSRMCYKRSEHTAQNVPQFSTLRWKQLLG